jgi:hypothetical protein
MMGNPEVISSPIGVSTDKRACIDWIGHFGAALRKSANPQDAPSLALVTGVHRHDKSLKFLVAQ